MEILENCVNFLKVNAVRKIGSSWKESKDSRNGVFRRLPKEEN